MISKREITDLTICRAVFAAWVFAYHVDLYLNLAAAFGPLATVIRHGYLGVDGFFILSGLILAHTHPTPPTQPAAILNFWSKRLARLYPVHFATILVFIALLAAGALTGHPPRQPARFSAATLLANLTLTQGWGAAAQGSWNYPAWSISTEWAGYLLFPWLWRIVSYFDRYVAFQTVVVCLLATGFIASLHHGSLNLAFTSGLIRFPPEFILGLATARLVPSCAGLLSARAMLAAGLALLGMFAFRGADMLAAAGLWLVLTACALAAESGGLPLFGHRPSLTRLGHLSYAFYMSFAVAELLTCQLFEQRHWLPGARPALFAALMLALTTALALPLHHLVERPSRRTLDRWLALPPRLPLPSKPL